MTAEEIAFELAAPFPQQEIRFRVGATTKDKRSGLPLAYIDARSVMHRLDAVLGLAGWKDEYITVGSGCVECRLSLRIGGEWITKSDVGTPSDQKGGDEVKAAYSDALKRAAVKFGIGRFLYDIEMGWHPINANGHFETPPRLPDWLNPENYYKNRPGQLAPAQPTQALAKKPADPVDPLWVRLHDAIQTEGSKGMSRVWEKEFTQAERSKCTGFLDKLKKQAAARDAELKHEAELLEWSNWLDGKPSLEAFNAMLPKLANYPKAKAAIWEACQEYAKAPERGWEFVADQRIFVSPL